jgi:succinate dehydrogenase/fumarate reductase flavoprotein subunit
MTMATRDEAEKALREHLGQELKAGTYALIDGGDGRWLVSRRGGPLAVDNEGQVHPVGEVFSGDEYSRIAAAWAF